MALKNLIEDQVIIIDDHKRGTGEIKNFDNPQNDVHIDKETNFKVDGKVQKVKIRVPINSDQPIKTESKRKEIPIPRRLNKEIRKAFEDKATREAFIKDVLETLSEYESVLSSEQKATSILERLSKHFDLNWDNDTIKKYREDILSSYTQFYTDKQGKKFFVKLDRRKITIGENNGYAKQFKKYNP
jgi:hypothetical protein